MKRICLVLTAVQALLAATESRAGDFTPATPVDEATVAAARASVPKTDDAAVRARIAAGLVGTWVSDGRIPGKVIFGETFERGWGPFTRRGVGSRIREDGRGGHSVELSVTPTNAYVSVCTEWGKAVRIDPKRLMAVLWEARTEHGGVAPLFVIDYCDAKGKRIRNPNCPSSVLADQPTMFHRNAWSLGDQVPAEARSAHLQFCVGKHALGCPCEFANVRLVDLTDAVDAALASERAVRAARASAPADAVLVYADDNLTATYPVLPDGAAMPGAAGAPLRLRECPGERTRATAILWSKTAHADVTVSFSDLKKGSDIIPSSALYAKIVKVHYQAAGAPNGMLVLADDQTLVPELLLNDDSLVVPDHRTHRNLVRHRWNGRTWYADINTIATKNFFTAPKAEELPIVDAKTLQPFDLPAGQNRQLMIRLAVPAGAKAGLYRGEVTFASRGRKVAALPVELEVLPFGLPKLAETVYDPNRVFEMGLYVWPYVRKDGQATLSPLGRSREQVLGEFRALVDNGITSPAFCWDAGLINDERRFREHLAILREAGFPGKTLHLGATGMLCKPKVYGVPLTDSEGLKEMQSRLVKAMAVARDYGFEEVYFYGIDEAKKDTVLVQIPAWKAAHEVGAKVMVSGYRGHFEMVGDVLDLIVYADDAAMEDVRPWHANGARLWKYNTPQTGPEDPGIYRRNYGLDLWRRGFDGANTYCDIGSSSAWNDLSGLQRLQRAGKPGANAYRTLCLFYPTVDGIVETLALTGFESAIKDVRVLTKFRQLLRARPNAAAQAWFDRLNPGSDDLVRVRREAIDWILRLESAPAAGCPDFDTASAWVTGVRWACRANKDRKSPPPVF